MNIKTTDLEGIYILEPAVHVDERGYFLETFREEYLQDHGLDLHFVQDNFSYSRKQVVRGLHYQAREAAQYKLIMVFRGEILDVAVDLRRQSPTFGRHLSVQLSDKNHRMVLIPEGFAHGFSVLSDEAAVYYKCSSYYDRELERGVRWNDPSLNIDWRVSGPVVSPKDQNQPLFDQLSGQDLF